jgi:hypothetical protein
VNSLRGSANRRERVSRRMERDSFREVVMPAGYVLGFFGLLGLLAAAVYKSSTGYDALEAVGLSLGLLVIPIALFLYRVVRGHFSDALDEP